MPNCNCGSKTVTYTVTQGDGTVLTGITSQSEAATIANRTSGTVRRSSK